MIQASVKTKYNFWGPPNTELGSKDKKTWVRQSGKLNDCTL